MDKIAADAVSAISAVAGDFACFTPLVFIPPHRGYFAAAGNAGNLPTWRGSCWMIPAREDIADRSDFSDPDWHSFMYVPVMKLVPDQRDKNIIKTMQPIPGYMDADHDDWTKSLSTALERVG